MALEKILDIYDEYLTWERDHYLSIITEEKLEENPHMKKLKDAFNEYGNFENYNDEVINIFCYVLLTRNNINEEMMKSRFDIYPKQIFIILHVLEPIFFFKLKREYYKYRELFFDYIKGVIDNVFILNENLQNIIENNIEYIKDMIKERDELNEHIRFTQ
jgi:hypothetical protein